MSDSGFALLPLSNLLLLKPPQEFDDHRDADDAVYELNGKELCSERYEMTASFLLNLALLALNEWYKSKLAAFTCHHHVHTAFIGGKVPKRRAVSGAVAVTALSFQGHD